MAQARDLRYSVPILHPGHITDELQATADKALNNVPVLHPGHITDELQATADKALIQCTDTNTSPLKHEW